MREGDIESPKVHQLFSRGLLRGVPYKRFSLLGEKFEYPDPDEIIPPNPHLHTLLFKGAQMLDAARQQEGQQLQTAARGTLERAKELFGDAERFAAGLPKGGDQSEDVRPEGVDRKIEGIGPKPPHKVDKKV